MIRKSILCSLSTLAAIASQGVAAQADDALFNASKPLEIVDQGTFSIPGRYVKAGEHTIMVGAMYVQYQIPKNKTRPYPIVFIHGGGQTAANYLSTPDGRRGWADDFVANGYAVYLVDQPGRGRSGFISAAYRKPQTQSVEENVSRLTDTKHRWPQDGQDHAHAIDPRLNFFRWSFSRHNLRSGKVKNRRLRPPRQRNLNALGRDVPAEQDQPQQQCQPDAQQQLALALIPVELIIGGVGDLRFIRMRDVLIAMPRDLRPDHPPVENDKPHRRQVHRRPQQRQQPILLADVRQTPLPDQPDQQPPSANQLNIHELRDQV